MGLRPIRIFNGREPALLRVLVITGAIGLGQFLAQLMTLAWAGAHWGLDTATYTNRHPAVLVATATALLIIDACRRSGSRKWLPLQRLFSRDRSSMSETAFVRHLRSSLIGTAR